MKKTQINVKVFCAHRFGRVNIVKVSILCKAIYSMKRTVISINSVEKTGLLPTKE